MEFSAKEIANILNGTVEGDSDVKVNDISKIEDGRPGTLSFLANPKYTKYIYTTNASIVIVNKSFVPEKEIKATLIKVADAYESFAGLMEIYEKQKGQKLGIEEQVYIDKTASIGDNVYIGAFTYIGKNAKIGKNVKIYPQSYIGDNVEIADNTLLYAGVKVYHDCKLGKNCIIHAGTVIGSDGFGFAPKSQKDYKKIPQLGNVIIKDEVEIGANCTIDRATLGSTVVNKGVKLDNLIQIAHNVEIGENTVICALTGISGSTKIGKECMIAGQVGMAGHIEIHDRVKIGAQSGISSSIKKELTVLGSPAFDINDYKRAIVVFKHLPEINSKLRYLEKEIKELNNKK